MISTEVRTQKSEKKVKKVCSLFSVLCLLFLAGCATTSDLENLRSSVTNIQIESINQKKEIGQIKTDLSSLSKDVTTLREYSLSAMKESQSSILIQTSNISKELQTLKGRFDENKYFMDKTIKGLFSERELLQAKIALLENETRELKAKLSAMASEIKEISNPLINPIPSAPADLKAAEANDPQKLYDDAQIDFKEKKYAEARQKFERFTKDFPKHALAPNSYFWIGEAYYAEKKYEDAILSYEAFLKRYPQHDKTRGAMLKQAYAFIELGDRKTGKVILERVIEKYPKSNEAKLAQKKIAEMLSKKKKK